MFTPSLYLTRLRKMYFALKLKWEHDKAISRTRNRCAKSAQLNS
jgi:hypothetical protein